MEEQSIHSTNTEKAPTVCQALLQGLTIVSSHCNLRTWFLLLAPVPQFTDGKTEELRNEVSCQGHTANRLAEQGFEPTSWLQNPPVLHHQALWSLLSVAPCATFRDDGDGGDLPPADMDW